MGFLQIIEKISPSSNAKLRFREITLSRWWLRPVRVEELPRQEKRKKTTKP